MHRSLAATRALGCAAIIAAAPAYAAEPDWGDYARLLERHVREDGAANRVDYAALRHELVFERVVEQLAAFPPERLASREERLAFYVNAYNILAIKVVLDHWPLQSIRDAGSLLRPVWRRPAGVVGGRTVTLDEIEHGLLRALGEPRIHIAIVCASMSCPDLRREPYTAAQLDDQVRRFLNHTVKGLRVEDGRIRTSRISGWFAPDFEPAGGVEAFVRRYRTDLPAGHPLHTDLPYDWSLNGG